MRLRLRIIQAEATTTGVVEADGISTSPSSHSREDLRVSHRLVQVYKLGLFTRTRPGGIICQCDWRGRVLLLLLLLLSLHLGHFLGDTL